jgi:hypothetical protein
MAEPPVKKQRTHSICAVALCRSNERSGVMFHAFPKDPTVCQTWVANCKRKDNFKPSTAHVCSLHFAPDAYKRDLYAELNGKPSKKRLESSSKQTLYLKKEDLEKKFPLVGNTTAAIAAASVRSSA